MFGAEAVNTISYYVPTEENRRNSEGQNPIVISKS